MKKVKALRFLYILSLTVCTAVLIFYAVGNPFDAVLTYRSAERINDSDYSGRMKISGVTYDKDKGLYIAELDDGNGVISEFIYDPSENSFINRYREDQISVVTYTARGNIIKKLNAEGVYPEEVIIKLECDAGIIGESCACRYEEVYVILENCGMESFTDKVVCVLKGLEGSGFQSYIILSDEYCVRFAADSISNNRSDIAARIKTRES